ncbi:MAG: hypothetical protein AAF902_08210 [Chloroflexota bacterium]
MATLIKASDDMVKASHQPQADDTLELVRKLIPGFARYSERLVG